MFTEKLEKISFYTGTIGILSLPISISITQFFLFLSSIIMIYIILKNKKFRISSILKKIIIVFLLQYIWLFIGYFLHKENIGSLLQSEWKDVFLVLYFFWSYYFIQSNYKKSLLNIIWITFIIFLCIGTISLFLPFRLSNLFFHLQNGFYFDGNIRAQHLVYPLNFFPFDTISWKLNEITYPIGIYMAVGFSGTHLSFGSQLSMIGLFFLFSTFFLINNKNIKGSMVYSILLLINLCILFFNQARSSMLGYFITSMIIFVILYFMYNKQIKIKKRFYVLIIVLILSFLFYIIYLITTQKWEEILSYIPFLQKKHTDYQRMLLWYVVIRIFLQNPITGIGMGNFKDTIFNEILKIIKEKPLLWYPLYQTEIMHAHNDFLHFLVSGGIISGILYLTLFFLFLENFKIIKKEFILNKNSQDSLIQEKNFLIFLFLPIFLLFAGIFQCYFLDDYTMQFFWILYGISCGILQQIQINKQKG